MELVFPAEHGLLTAGGLPVAESDTQPAHTRPEPFRIYAGLPRWLADEMSAVHSSRSLVFVTASMRRLDVVRVLVSQRCHASRMLMIRHDVAVIVRSPFAENASEGALHAEFPRNQSLFAA